MRVAVASGKGGTGKTLVSTNLAWLLARAGERVIYVDTDVEAPNGHLYLHPSWTTQTRFSVPVPALAAETCSGCGACQKACAFNAILALRDRVLTFPQLCHACGACQLVCEQEALVERRREVGTLRQGSSDGLTVWDAVLDVGEAMAPPLIRGLLAAMSQAHPPSGQTIVIVDAPPGTSCSAITAVQDADLVLLVTEPTPFGLHDLRLAVGMCRAVGRPVAAVVNRADLGDGGVVEWLTREAIPVFAEIPFSHEVAAAYADGELAARRVASLSRTLTDVARRALGRAA